LARAAGQRNLPGTMAERPAGRGALNGPALLLVGLVVLSPWPVGSAYLRTTQAIAILGLLASLLALVMSWRAERSSAAPAPSVWPADLVALGAVLVLWSLALAQLLPLPPALHTWLAPGSAALWHPAPAAAAAVLGAGSRPSSVDPAATARWLAFSAAVLGLVLVAGPALRSRATVLRASIAVVSAGVLVASYGLAARLLFGDKLYGVFAVPTIAPFGPFVSKNHFAGYVELSACLALGLAAGLADESRSGPGRLSWLDSRRAGWVVAAWGAAVVLVIAVPVSLSRGGMVSLAAGLAAFAGIRLSTRPGQAVGLRGAILAVGGLALVAVMLALLLPDTARDRVRTLGGVDQAGVYRLDVWRDSLHLATSSLAVGSGFGAYADALPRFKTGAGDVGVEHAENDYLELLCEGGLVGAALAAIAVAGLLAAGWRVVRDEPHRLSRGVRAGALAGLTALLVHSVFDFNLRIPSNALLAGFLLSCVLSQSSAVVPTTSGRSGRRGLLGTVVLACALLVALFLALIGRWTPDQVDTGALQRVAVGAPGLRGAALERDIVAHLQGRPGDANAWAALAWLRLPRSASEAAALAGWSQVLDPRHAALRQATQRVMDAAQSQPRKP
jgi:O-antigen ligase